MHALYGVDDTVLYLHLSRVCLSHHQNIQLCYRGTCSFSSYGKKRLWVPEPAPLRDPGVRIGLQAGGTVQVVGVQPASLHCPPRLRVTARRVFIKTCLQAEPDSSMTQTFAVGEALYILVTFSFGDLEMQWICKKLCFFGEF